MHLTDEEKRMLDGERGAGVRKAMDMLVAMGKAFDAPKMIPVSKAHVAMSGQEGDTYWCELLLNGGATCKVVPTTNPNWDVPVLSRHYEVPADRLFLARRTDDVYRRIGASITYCCTPELAGNVPVFGEHVAFSESSATPYVNAVLGARSNRESSVSALASAVTGVTPYYGLHLGENRKGNMTVYVDTELHDAYDWGLLGWYVGLHAGAKVPVIIFNEKAFEGPRPTQEELLYFTTESSTSGAVPMFHMVGITPEAPTAEVAFGGSRSEYELRVTRKNLDEMERLVSDPAGKGSSVVQLDGLFQMMEKKNLPRALIVIDPDPVLVSSVYVVNVPMVDRTEKSPYDIIKDGDWVKVDSDSQTVTITKQDS